MRNWRHWKGKGTGGYTFVLGWGVNTVRGAEQERARASQPVDAAGRRLAGRAALQSPSVRPRSARRAAPPCVPLLGLLPAMALISARHSVFLVLLQRCWQVKKRLTVVQVSLHCVGSGQAHLQHQILDLLGGKERGNSKVKNVKKE